MENKKLENILDKFKDLEKKINSLNKDDFKEFAKLSKEYSDLKPLVEKINLFLKLTMELNDLDDLLKSDDMQLKNEAEREKEELTNKIAKALEEEANGDHELAKNAAIEGINDVEKLLINHTEAV